jgi:hypothetical protein
MNKMKGSNTNQESDVTTAPNNKINQNQLHGRHSNPSRQDIPCA